MTDDAPARLRALEPGQSFIVRAPAGSGKTTLLTHRVLRLLTTVEHPEQVVAITFTRKAAEEMRARIVNALGLARGPRPDDAFDGATWDLAAAVARHDERLGWDLAAQPSRLRIMTIDALNASLVRQMPLGAGMSGARSTEEDARELYQEAARDAVGAIAQGGTWNRTVAKVLGHLDNDWGRLEALLADMLARRDQWLRVLADGSERAVLESSFERVVEHALSEAAAVLPVAVLDALAGLGAYAGAQLAADDPLSPIARLAGRTGAPGVAASELPAWQGLAALVLTKDGNWRKRIDRTIGFAPKAPGVAARKQALVDVIADLTQCDAALAALRHVAALPATSLDEDDWAICQALLQLLRAATAHLMVTGERTGRADFIAVAMAALDALGQSDMPSDLALRMDYRVQHLLVDEFQDTSRTQYELIERLTAGWSGDDGRSLFLVGDPMQSIYRFRQADVSLFTDVIGRGGLGSIALEPLQLSANFRSQAALVDWINVAIPPALDTLDDDGRHFAAQRPVRGAGGPAFTLLAATVHDGERETAAMLDTIMRLRDADPQAGIAILVRSRTHLGGITATLLEHGLPVAAREIQPFTEIPAIGDLLALTRALLHPADRIAWYAVLRAPWCGLTLASLETLAQHETTVLEAMQAESCAGTLERGEYERMVRVRDLLQVALAQRSGQSFSACVERAWLDLGGPACVASEQQFADVRAYFRMLAEVEHDGRVMTGARIERRIADHFSTAPGADVNAVQVMTIHRAKGLEFDYVLIPGAGRRPRADSRQLLAWREGRDRAQRPTLLMAPLPARTGGQMYDYLRGLDLRETSAEAVRLLYVALTRAREGVVMFGHAKADRHGDPAPEKGSFLSMLWPVVGADFDPRSALPPATAADRGDRARLRRLDPENLVVPQPGAVAAVAEVPAEPEFEWAGATAKHIGTVTHRLLHALGGLPDAGARRVLVRNAADHARARLRALGVPPGELDEAATRVALALDTTLRSERGSWLYSADHEEVRAEYALSAVDRGELVRAVIDRTFVDPDGRRWIVDFKTGSHSGGELDAWLDSEVTRYRAQLERYARIIAAVDERPVMLGLYFPLLDAWRSWSFSREPRGARQ